jgi:hypothetical protein
MESGRSQGEIEIHCLSPHWMSISTITISTVDSIDLDKSNVKNQLLRKAILSKRFDQRWKADYYSPKN